MRRSTIKSIAAIALTGAGSALVVGFRTTEVVITGTAGGTTSAAGSSSAGSTSAANGQTGTAGTGSTTTGAAGVGQYADGTYQGAAVDEPWGTFQVQAVISGGKLTDVVLVASPADNHSGRINSQTVPMLTQSAIAAQSANVDMVSGATWTSQSYATSLQAALDQARAAVNTAS
jgi:uncharacterized protein with FMN-binding domain